MLTFSQGLWLVLSYGPYIRLVIGFLFTSLAFMVILKLMMSPPLMLDREALEEKIDATFSGVY